MYPHQYISIFREISCQLISKVSPVSIILFPVSDIMSGLPPPSYPGAGYPGPGQSPHGGHGGGHAGGHGGHPQFQAPRASPSHPSQMRGSPSHPSQLSVSGLRSSPSHSSFSRSPSHHSSPSHPSQIPPQVRSRRYIKERAKQIGLPLSKAPEPPLISDWSM